MPTPLAGRPLSSDAILCSLLLLVNPNVFYEHSMSTGFPLTSPYVAGHSNICKGPALLQSSSPPREAACWLAQGRKLISIAPQNLTVIKAEVNETRQIE